MSTQRRLNDALLDRMEKLERKLRRKYGCYVKDFVPDEDHPMQVQYLQWVDGEPECVELEAHRAAYFALPINKE